MDVMLEMNSHHTRMPARSATKTLILELLLLSTQASALQIDDTVSADDEMTAEPRTVHAAEQKGLLLAVVSEN